MRRYPTLADVGARGLASRLRESIDNDHRATDQSEGFKALLNASADALIALSEPAPPAPQKQEEGE